jgi:hypothetical protein
MDSNAKIRSIVLAIWALWLIWAFGISTLGRRLWVQLDGTVISSRDIPFTRGSRYATEYTLLSSDGREIHYTAGPTDSSLPRSIPVGTKLEKQRWRLGYERDGTWVNDFGLTFYVLVLAIAFSCLAWSAALWRRQRLKSDYR